MSGAASSIPVSGGQYQQPQYVRDFLQQKPLGPAPNSAEAIEEAKEREARVTSAGPLGKVFGGRSKSVSSLPILGSREGLFMAAEGGYGRRFAEGTTQVSGPVANPASEALISPQQQHQVLSTGRLTQPEFFSAPYSATSQAPTQVANIIPTPSASDVNAFAASRGRGAPIQEYPTTRPYPASEQPWQSRAYPAEWQKQREWNAQQQREYYSARRPRQDYPTYGEYDYRQREPFTDVSKPQAAADHPFIDYSSGRYQAPSQPAAKLNWRQRALMEQAERY